MNTRKTLSCLVVSFFLFGCSGLDNVSKVTENTVQIKDFQGNAELEIFPEEELITSKNVLDLGSVKKKSQEKNAAKKEVSPSEKLSFSEGLSFPVCKSRWQLRSREWYDSFHKKLSERDSVSEKNIALLCESANTEVVLAMLNGNVLETGGILRYRVQDDILEEALFTEPVSLHLYEFKGRAENIIPVLGGLREENGCEDSFRLNYDFLSNEIAPIVKCTKCSNQPQVCDSF